MTDVGSGNGVRVRELVVFEQGACDPVIDARRVAGVSAADGRGSAVGRVVLPAADRGRVSEGLVVETATDRRVAAEGRVGVSTTDH